MKKHNQVIENTSVSIFATMSKMAFDHKAINLAQGFPNFEGPEFVIAAAEKAFRSGHNQYAPYPGVLKLRKGLSDLYRSFHKFDSSPEQFTITSGATEAIFCTILSLINPGDEVIMFEPYYDSYLTTVKLAGGIPKFVTLTKPEFTFSRADLEAVVSDKTKLVIFNNPHNPSGRVFKRSELDLLSKFCIDFDLYCMSDEVYEFLVFDDQKHIPMISLPGMENRTIGISSFGKTFGLTGWKVGWAVASAELTHSIRMLHQFNTFSVNHPLQYALADALSEIDNYLKIFSTQYQQKRDLFYNKFSKLGFEIYPSEGTYFSLCDVSKTGMTDVEFCKHLIVDKKVAAIPCSAFYSKSAEGEELVRFCFAKTEETLLAAARNLSDG